MFNSLAIWLDPAQQNGHGAQYESNSIGIWHKCCEGIWFESVKTSVQVLATWTQAHTFLLELAQESDCGTSLLLDPEVELWKTFLKRRSGSISPNMKETGLANLWYCYQRWEGDQQGSTQAEVRLPERLSQGLMLFSKSAVAASKPPPPSKPICSHLMPILFCLSQEGCWHILIWFLTPPLSPGF